MSKLNITPGSVSVFFEPNDAWPGLDSDDMTIVTYGSVSLDDDCGIKGKTKEEACANAQLYAEAHNVANECGLMPRELLQQRDELVERLTKIVQEYHERNIGDVGLDIEIQLGWLLLNKIKNGEA